MLNTNETACRLRQTDLEDLIHAFDMVHRPGQHVAFTLEHALSLLLHSHPDHPASEAARSRLSAAISSAFARAFRQNWTGISRAELIASLNAALSRANGSTAILAGGFPEIKLTIYGLRAAMLREDIARRGSSVTIGTAQIE